jgi:iron complex outermembrane receptor protein
MSGVLRFRSQQVALPVFVLATGLLPASFAEAQTLASSAGSAASAAGVASSAPSAEVEGVIVTANRRASNLQATPLAITAISGDTLDKTFTNEISGLNAIVPSLEITKTSGFENLVTIRGVGSETPENAPTTVPGVSEFIDGVYIANTVSLDQTLFDIDHIEVLRGPQGALYGQSSIGGAITIVTKQPVLNTFDGSGDVSIGNYNLFRERAEVNVPVNDQVAVRASIQKYDHDGFTKDVAIPGLKLDDADDVGGKAAVLWKPSGAFSATLTGQLYYADQNGAAQKNINDPNSDPRVLNQDYPGHFALYTQLYHLNMEWDFPVFALKSVTAYQGLDNRIAEDSSRSSISILNSYDDVAAWDTKLANYTEEFDILSLPGSKLDWIAGAFVLVQTSNQFVAEFEGKDTNPNLNIASNIETAPPANLPYGNRSRVARRSYSGFGQATYHILPALRLTVGARINYDSYSLDSLNFSGGPNGSINTVSHGYSDSEPTGRLQLDYDVSPLNLVYGSVSRGYKPGGVNGIASALVVPNSFQAETNTAFEVGSKNQFLDRSLTLNVAAFYYLYRDMQYIEQDPVPFDGGMANIPSVHIYGAEAEAGYTSFERHLHVNGSLALENGQVQGDTYTIDSTVQNAIEGSYAFPCYAGPYTLYGPGAAACAAAVEAGARNIKGKTPPAMPKISGSINAAYAFDLPTGTLTPRIEYVYRGSEWARIFNEPALDRVKAYGVVDLNLEYAPSGSRLRLSLTGTNVFNVAGVNSRYTDPYGTGQTSQEYIPPAQVIGSIKYAF